MTAQGGLTPPPLRSALPGAAGGEDAGAQAASSGQAVDVLADGREQHVRPGPREHAMFQDLRERLTPLADAHYPSSPSRQRAPPSARKKPSVLLQVASGVAGSLLAECLLFPIDTVKIRVQSATDAQAGGFLAVALQVLRQGGLRSFYNGLRTSLFKETVHSSNFWLWHTLAFRLFSAKGDTSGTPTFKRLLLNLLAKQLNWLCSTPFEVVSSVNQITKGSPGFFVVAARLYRQDGLGAFYRGLFISMVLAVNPAIMNTLITTILSIISQCKRSSGMDHWEAREHSPALIGSVTAFAKIIATVISYPLIRIKVLQQTGAFGGSKPAGQIFQAVLETEGASGLYRGVLAMSYKTVLWNSIMMTIKSWLSRREVSPPSTPIAISTLVPTMGRVPFPYEMLTVEKLDELLDALRHPGDHERGRQIDNIERRLDKVTDEMKEIKDMLSTVVSLVGTADSRDGAEQGSQQKGAVRFTTT
eukprot:TRINITY_DN90292_c0_g1_i1.p1 TRINITY_DN90292_c0_g1~~TRINITY_DN90292_c0_g1_i1.p1  ORF type:complete len:474 (-),score=60.76 TRINITY_DN90292_c0_g1_i1:126-1547(-)